MSSVRVPLADRRRASAARIDLHSRPQREQVDIVAAIQWQIIDGLIAQRPAQCGIGWLDHWERLGYGNLFRLFARLQRQIDANIFAHLEQNPRTLRSLETFGLGANYIGPGREVRRIVLTCVICSQSARDAALHIKNGYGSARHDATRLIVDAAQDTPQIGLRQNWHNRNRHQESGQQSIPAYDQANRVSVTP